MQITKLLPILPLLLAAVARATSADTIEALHHATPDHVDDAAAESATYPTSDPSDYPDLYYPAAVTKRDKPKGVFVCNKPGWKGNCWVMAIGKNKDCQKWDEIKSMGPDNGLACDLFEGEECKGKPAVRFVTYPGVDDTRKGGLKSWKCGVK